MTSWLSRLTGGRDAAPAERKSVHSMFALTGAGSADWSRGGAGGNRTEGYRRNPVVYRCVRMIADAATRVPLNVTVDGLRQTDHPALRLLGMPNPRQSGGELMEALFTHLHTNGNAYLEAALADGEVKGLYALRPDRVQVVSGADGWPLAYDYAAGGRTVRLSQATEPVPRVLHLRLFHPFDDHYGLAPLEAARDSFETHEAAARWNRALLDNAARPSGALVYSAEAGNLTPDQFARLKEELEAGFQGAMNAGRPMVLEGGLDWKAMALTPRDMDFIEARNGAAREIALAFGVPPMLLGIPGDNTYANYAEANRAFWRQTVVPLVNRTAGMLERWLQPAFEAQFALVPDLDGVEALAEDRASLWKRVGAAEFLTDDEKRKAVGLTAAHEG